MSYGLLSALSWGISTLLAAVAARRIGALRTVRSIWAGWSRWWSRGGAMVILLGLLATPLRGAPAGRLAPGTRLGPRAGLTDAAGLVFFTRGDQVGLVAVTAAVSSAYPVIPLIGGLLFFRERLMRLQVGERR